MIWAQDIKDVMLRQAAPACRAFNEVAAKVKEDLGFTLEMTALDSDAVTQRAATQPDSYRHRRHRILDLQEGLADRQPAGDGHVARSRITTRSSASSRDGKLTPESVIAQGTAPHTVGFVEAAGRQGIRHEATGWMTLIPTIYNADTLGIRPDLIGRPIETWTELLNPEFKGKASILDISSIGIMDMAMVCEAMGEIKYGDKGNMTTEEIDKTMAIFTEAKKAGQFRAFWKSFDESVNLMASGEVVIQSMWSPAITAVRSQGHPLRLSAAEGRLSQSGAAASVCRRACRGWRWMRPMNTSTGICRAGSAAS